jgi:hypothetical protein
VPQGAEKAVGRHSNDRHDSVEDSKGCSPKMGSVLLLCQGVDRLQPHLHAHEGCEAGHHPMYLVAQVSMTRPSRAD